MLLLLVGFFYIIKKESPRVGINILEIEIEYYSFQLIYNSNSKWIQNKNGCSCQKELLVKVFFATKLNDVVGLARANSLWPLPFATSCCGIEFMATMASHYDLARFGSERVSFSPRQADMLDGYGNYFKKNGPNFTSGIRTNVRTSLGYFCWCLCLFRRCF